VPKRLRGDPGAQMRNREAQPSPRETISIIEALVGQGLLCDEEFRHMHRMKRSISNFKSYCAKHEKFNYDGNNHPLALSLQKKLHQK
jgi:hypothetical protein